VVYHLTTILWNDGNTSLSRTGLCPGVDYSYTVSDSLGCSWESILVQITCEGPQLNVYKFGRIAQTCDIMIDDFKYVELISPPNISDVYTLESIGGEQVYNGCWSYIGVVGGVADAQLSAAWIDCEACQGILLINKYLITENCETAVPTGGTLAVALSTTYPKGLGPLVQPIISNNSVPMCERNYLSQLAHPGNEGWYYFNPRVQWTNLVNLPTDTTISVLRVKGNGNANEYTVLETLYSIILQNEDPNYLISGTNVNFTFTTPTAYYLQDQSSVPYEEQESFMLVVYRDPGTTCVTGVAPNDAVLNMSFSNFSNIKPYYVGTSPVVNVMSATDILPNGSVVNTNELVNTCFEVIGESLPDATVDYTYNETTGIYESCVACETPPPPPTYEL
jgi:hypothetical protein